MSTFIRSQHKGNLMEIVQLMLEKAPEVAEAQTKYGWTPLDVAAQSQDRRKRILGMRLP